MPKEHDAEVTSDAEGPEKKTREELQKTTISNGSKDAATVLGGDVAVDTDPMGEDSHEAAPTSEPMGLRKKRSHEEISDAPLGDATKTHARHHTRKRSRGSSPEEEELNNGQRKSGERARGEPDADVATNGAPKAPATERSGTPEQTGDKDVIEDMSSPKIKRSRLQSDLEEADAMQNGEEDAGTFTAELSTEDKTTTKIPPASGSANTSTSLPFASLAGQKSPTPEAASTSTSAFASSAFGSLAGSTTSGFGAVGKSSGGFGSGGSFATGASKEESKESSSAFGGALGQKSVFSTTMPATEASTFGSSASGFGKLSQGSAFGGTGFSSLGGGSGLTSFASGKPSSLLANSSKPMKTFGAAGRDEEDDGEDGGEEDDESGFRSPLSQESDKQDERFYHQEVDTGEEGEKKEVACRAKLYNFVPGPDGKKEWKERGIGNLTLNCRWPAEDEEDAKPSVRLLMRADGSHNVALNSPVKKELKFGALDGGKPGGSFLFFAGVVDGKAELVPLMFKVSFSALL